MAVIYYPKGQFLARDTQSGSYQSFILSAQPNVVLYFDTGSGLNAISASLLPITASFAANSPLSILSDTTYFVRTDGNDSNTGLANNSSSAFLTIQKGVNTVANCFLASGVTATVQIADGNYTESVTLRPFGGPGAGVIKGNIATASAVVIQGGTQAAFSAFQKTNWILTGMEVRSSGGNDIQATAGSLTLSSSMRYGSASAHHIIAQFAGNITMAGGYSIVGGGFSHITSYWGGFVSMPASPITCSGTPNFAGAFMNVGANGSVFAWNNTFTGSATGKRYAIALNGVVDTNAAGVNYFPGNSAGTSGSGGQYS